MADYNFITVRLATGAALQGAADVDALAAAGVTHIIDLRGEFDDAPLLGAHFTYLWNGVPDDGNPATHGADWFAKSLEFALAALAKPGAKVLAHCAAGVNRGPSTAMCILMAQGLSAGLAESLCRQARPQVGLAYKDQAVAAVRILGYV